MAEPTEDQPEKPDDDAELARYWLGEIDTSEKDPERQRWMKRAKEIIRIYTDKREENDRTDKRFALFWSNIEVLKPATLARSPEPVVSRRFKDADPVGRCASEVLERCLKFSSDDYDLQGTLFACRDEYLLVGRALPWVRYIPHIKKKDIPAGGVQVADDGESYDVVEWEEVRADYIHYADFLTNIARQWQEVWWGARIAYLTRKECIDRFGEEKGGKVPLDWAPEGQAELAESRKKARIYEIWDRKTKRTIWVSKGCTEWTLDVRDDPLKLKGFFPFPKPALGTVSPDSMIPVPDYIYYQDQCREIDTLTARISRLIDALKVRGFYSSKNQTDLNNLLSSGDNVLIPVDSWAALGDSGGLKGIIEWMPIDIIAGTLKACIETRREIISDVYQLTGISDIQRGDTDPDETLGAQQLKANYGSARVHERKKELGRLARDVLDLKGQIMASQFSQETLATMSDVKLLTNAEKAQVQQQMQAQQQYQQMQQQMQAQVQQPPQLGMPPAQQPPMPPAPPPPNPDQVKLMGEPSWEDVMDLLRSPTLRAFRIDIETDSTIEPDDQQEKQRRIEFVTAVGQFVSSSLPVIQAMPALLPVITQSLLFLVRGFRVGREMEDVIEEALEKLQSAPPAPQPEAAGPAPPNPAVEQAKAEASKLSAEASMTSAQAAQQRVQVDAFKAESDREIGLAQVEAEKERTHADMATSIHDTIARATERRETAQQNRAEKAP